MSSLFFQQTGNELSSGDLPLDGLVRAVMCQALMYPFSTGTALVATSMWFDLAKPSSDRGTVKVP